MPRRADRAALLGLALWAASSLLAGSGGCTSASSVENRPWDADRDGLFDHVIVGDFDGDGVREMDDVQDAVDALTDPGPKLVTVQAGDYAAPASPGLRPGRTHAVLELGSHTTLACAGATRLRAAPLGPEGNYAVVSNHDHVNGNDAIAIQGCELDGAAPAAYSIAGLARTQRMGVWFRRTRGSEVTDSLVHDTVHAGLYSSNSSGDRFLRNVVEDAGAWGATNGTWRQPCLYLYAFGGASVSDFVAADNVLRRCGNAGLNTRAEDTDAPGDAIRNLLWERNAVEQARSSCASLRGVDGAVIRALSCSATAGITLSRGAGSGWRTAGNDDANSNVTLEDVTVANPSSGQAGLDVGAWVDGLSVRRLRVDGARAAGGAPLGSDCAWLQRPLRGALLEDVELRGCGREGLLVTSLAPAAGPEETLALRRVLVADVDQAAPLDAVPAAGIHFAGAHAELWLEDLDLSAATGPELRFDGALSNATLRRVTVDSVDPGWLGAFAEAEAPACTSAREGRWLTTRDGSGAGDCSFGGGTGTAPARCGCLGGAWTALLWATAPGIDFASGVTHERVALEDVTVANARAATGVRAGGALAAFTALRLLGLDDSLATDPPQRSAIDFEAASGWSASEVSCVGTDPALPCIE